jgi:hypothetical protein
MCLLLPVFIIKYGGHYFTELSKEPLAKLSALKVVLG